MRGSSRAELGGVALAIVGVVEDGVDVMEDVPLGDGRFGVVGAKLFERPVGDVFTAVGAEITKCDPKRRTRRRAIADNRNVLTKLTELEHRLEGHDSEIQALIDAIRELMAPEEPNRRRIGFEAPAEDGGKAVKERLAQSRKSG